jgi:hypothetical protein
MKHRGNRTEYNEVLGILAPAGLLAKKVWPMRMERYLLIAGSEKGH